MICTEVGELMQRQLDHDLDEKELTLLMTHLSECIACKDLFERLTLLSGSLEQLPRVTPSINIVDSILPELDAIDRQRSSEAKNKRYSRMRWMTTTASVAAAAAVVFIMSIGWNGSGSKHDVTYDVAFSPETRIADPSGVSPLAKIGDEFMDRSDAMSDAGNFSIEPMTSPSSIAQFTDKEEKENIESGNQAITEQTSPPTMGITKNPNNDPQKNKVNEESNQGGFVQEDTEADYGMMGIAEVTESADQDSASFNVAAEELELAKNYSPDEQVYVVFEGHTIALYETSTNELIRTWETSVAGTARLTVWDQESKSFNYEITDEQGKNHSFTQYIDEQNE